MSEDNSVGVLPQPARSAVPSGSAPSAGRLIGWIDSENDKAEVRRTKPKSFGPTPLKRNDRLGTKISEIFFSHLIVRMYQSFFNIYNDTIVVYIQNASNDSQFFHCISTETVTCRQYVGWGQYWTSAQMLETSRYSQLQTDLVRKLIPGSIRTSRDATLVTFRPQRGLGRGRTCF